jgi:hypothetical protein
VPTESFASSFINYPPSFFIFFVSVCNDIGSTGNKITPPSPVMIFDPHIRR